MDEGSQSNSMVVWVEIGGLKQFEYKILLKLLSSSVQQLNVVGVVPLGIGRDNDSHIKASCHRNWVELVLKGDLLASITRSVQVRHLHFTDLAVLREQSIQFK